MTLENLESILESASTATSYSRGLHLFQNEAVFDTYRQGILITGKCEGNSEPFYRIQVRLDEGGIQEAFCDCPYDRSGYCKHIIALILAYIHNPDRFIEQESIEEMLAKMEKVELISLIGKMIEKNPDLYDWMQKEVQPIAEQNTTSESHSIRNTEISIADYRRQIQYVLHSLDGYRPSQAYWMMGGMVDELRQMSDSAQAFLNKEDAKSALAILTTLLIEVGSRYPEFDDSEGELGGFLQDLILPMVESILSLDLNTSERRRRKNELENVIEDLQEYEFFDLDAILVAYNYGWSDKPLDDLEDYNNDPNLLNEAKLNILDRNNRTAEFLDLCLKAGQYLRFILKMIEIGEFDTAFDIASKTLTQAEDILQVSKKLREGGHLTEALHLAEQGLKMGGSKVALGSWLGQIEESQERIEQAIQAYQAAFIQLPSLSLYQTLKRLCDTDWKTFKPTIMGVFENGRFSDDLVSIYLFEKEWDAAIAIADCLWESQYDLVEKVVDKVINDRQDWAIQMCLKQAQLLINRTQSKYYSIAVLWLAKVKRAYLSTGKKSEWQSYLEGLKTKYARRPALQEELRRL